MPERGVRRADERTRLAALARALDAAVRIPGTNVRVGLDALIGLVPGVGDVAGAAIAGYIVPVRRSGLSNSYTIRGILAISGRRMSGKSSAPRR